MGLLDSNRFLYRGNVSGSVETFNLTTANDVLKVISPKSGYGCIAITVVMDTPDTMLYLRKLTLNSLNIYEKYIDEDGEIHYNISYLNTRSGIDGVNEKTYFVLSDEVSDLRLCNRYAVSGATAKVKVTYLKDMPKYLNNLKPRQIIYSNVKTFAAGDTINNLTVPNNDESEISRLLKYFKYLAVEVVFCDSSNKRKAFSGSFVIKGRLYAPAPEHSLSAISGDDFELYSNEFSNSRVIVSDMFEAKGAGIRFETSLTTAAAEGDKMVFHLIGIR